MDKALYNESKRKLERRKWMLNLLETTEFKEIFLKHYMKETLNEMIYREGSSPGVMVELNARKNFHDYIYGIIDEGEQAEEQLKKGN